MTPPTNLQSVLDKLEQAVDASGQTTVGSLVQAAGRRSFGTLLLVPSLILASPISAVPSVPTAMGVLVVLTCGQLLLHRQAFWLPGWIVRRQVPERRLARSIHLLRPPARFVDRLLRPRLLWFTEGWRVHVMAAICLLLALGTTPLELIPGANTAIGTALTAFALALLAHDGVLALVGLTACAALVGTLGWLLF
ncbi:exopolysaccharide biosynthesis protein [Dyella sp.]|jgi:hypothetical protein|uniref:exopolysaccharide biosynthesis protein n=1 Tax=Dyella sp. TaxID=1869338 RepID=UPI002D796574|nr:exopolysaccharide biosynthesis protein [Dyella sp.]HET6433569.1 exopolysaccharide biosynthesis protein [Dyella sp.]